MIIRILTVTPSQIPPFKAGGGLKKRCDKSRTSKVGNIRQWIFSLLRHRTLDIVITDPTRRAGGCWKQRQHWCYKYVQSGMSGTGAVYLRRHHLD